METNTKKGPDHKQEDEDGRASFIEDEKRHAAIPPVWILDVDKGLDFTFVGLGLKGNRDKNSVD
jgi:hypothetical protein